VTPQRQAAESAVFQVRYVVPDLEAARAYLEGAFGIGPWLTIPKTRIADRTYRGKPTPHAYEAVSLAFVGELQIEIMQPVVGPSIYLDFLKAHPSGGIHHIAMRTADFDAAVAGMGGAEAVVQSGRVGDFRFAFFDAPALGGAIEVVCLDEAAQAMLDDFRQANVAVSI